MKLAIPASIAVGLAMAGCTPGRTDLPRVDELRKDNSLVQASASNPVTPGGRLIAPKRCYLRTAIISKPFGDPAINDMLWSVVDEQGVDPEIRRALESNGLRLGLIAGSLPGHLDELFRLKTPEKIVPTEIDVPDGDQISVTLGGSRPQASLLLNRQGRVEGKDYADASGLIRVSAGREAAGGGVSLRLVPEVHHGAVRHGYAASEGAPMEPRQFVIKDGQDEELFPELAATLAVRPGQVAVLGCRAVPGRGLGQFLFVRDDETGHREQQVLLIWAERTNRNAFGNDQAPPSPAPPPGPLVPTAVPASADPA